MEKDETMKASTVCYVMASINGDETTPFAKPNEIVQVPID